MPPIAEMPLNLQFYRFRERAWTEAQNVQRIRGQIAEEFLPRYEKLRYRAGIPKEELHKWVEDALKKLPEIERLLSLRLDQRGCYDELTQKIVQGSKLAYETAHSSSNTITEIDKLKREKDDAVKVEVRETIRELINVAGVDVVKEIFHQLISDPLVPTTIPNVEISKSINSDTNNSTSGVQHRLRIRLRKPEIEVPKNLQIDPRIIDGCIEYLGGKTLVEWKVENVVECMKSAYDRNISIEQKMVSKSSVTAPTPNTQVMDQIKAKRDRKVQSSFPISDASPVSVHSRNMVSNELAAIVSPRTIASISSTRSDINHIPTSDNQATKEGTPVSKNEVFQKVIPNSNSSIIPSPNLQNPSVNQSAFQESKHLSSHLPSRRAGKSTSASDSLSVNEVLPVPDNQPISTNHKTPDYEIMYKDLVHSNQQLAYENDELRTNFKKLTVLNDDFRNLSDDLKCHLLFNKNFNLQVSIKVAEACFSSVMEQHEELRTRKLVLFKKSIYPISLADNLENIPFKPTLSYKQHLFVLLSTFPRGSPDQLRIEYSDDQAQYHILWLSSLIPSIIKTCANDEYSNRLFTFYLENIINFCFLKGLARASLFITVANLNIRELSAREDGDYESGQLWWDLHNMVSLGKMGNPSYDWNFIESLSFYYFLSAGPQQSPMTVHIAQTSTTIFEVIQNIRGTTSYDFIGLLSHPVVQKILSLDPKTSALIASNGQDKIAIVRTKSSREGQDKEYIWTRESGTVTLSLDGVLIDVVQIDEELVIYIKARSSITKTWFRFGKDKERDLRYFEKHYSSTLAHSMKVYLEKIML